MQIDGKTVRNILSADLLDVFIRVGLLVFLVILCARVISPFVNLALWSVVLAVALYPMQQKLAVRFGGRQGRAATVLVLAGILLIGVPTAMLGGSFANHMHTAYNNFESGDLTIPEPKPSVEQWPVVGERVYTAWNAAATNLPHFIQQYGDQLKQLAGRALGAAASTAGAVALFIGSLIVAGIIMAYGVSGSESMRTIIDRIAGSHRGPHIQTLITATVRSVATGVIGVAFIQALILGIGFIWAGIPAAGLLALVVMVVGILQAPALLITVPVIAYLWSSGDASTSMNLVYTIYLFVGGLADNVLKPLLLGRGVDAPMPVILLGALGGMVTGGIVGLFVGAVLLAVGYQLFMDWVAHAKDPDGEVPASAE